MFAQQSIQNPIGVTVFGSHVLRVEPDYATISFAVIHVAPDPKAAIDALEKSRSRVSQVLVTRRVAAVDVTTSHVSLHLAADGYGKDRRVLGYQAQVDYQVRCHDLGAVPALVIELVDAGAKSINGVRYQTTKVRELRGKARDLAFGSARAKAEGYAQSASMRIGRVLHIEDVNPDSLAQRGHMPDVDLTEHSDFEAGGTGSIAIAGAVMVCFALVDQ
jgi:uncharacterized protein YggE